MSRLIAGHSMAGLGALVVLLLVGCESAYYGAWEKVGVHKRDILVDRVEDAAEAQQEAKEEFQSALEKFSSVVEVPPSRLKETYETLSEAFEEMSLLEGTS